MGETVRLLSESTAYCAECGCSHRVTYEDRAGKVFYSIECPNRPTETLVSSNSEFFSAMRSRQSRAPHPSAWSGRAYDFYVIAITDRCNIRCPVCYAACSPAGQRFLSLDELRRAARLVKSNGGRRLSMSGGEPTMHPQLPEMIRIVRQEIGLSPVLVTNGLRIAEDYSFLLTLKAAGLRRVHLQFDTLDNETYRAIRGRNDVGEKLRAVDHVVSAGMHLGLVSTVCALNLGEAGKLLEFAQQLVPALRILVFQPAVPTGRFPDYLQTVTREDVVRALTGFRGSYVLRESDFAPFPRPESGHQAAHPDCSAHVLMCSDGSHACPLSTQNGVSSCSAKRQRVCSNTGLLTADVLTAGIVRELKNRGGRTGRWRPFFVSLISFMRPGLRDDNRLHRCVVGSVTDRSIVPLCESGCPLASRARAAQCQPMPEPQSLAGTQVLRRAAHRVV